MTWAILTVILAVLVVGLVSAVLERRRDWTHRGLPPASRDSR